MTLANYTELAEEVADWFHRSDDTAFVAKIPTFVRLAEARFNRALRMASMEETLSSTALTDGAVTLPAGFLAFKELRYVGSTSYTLYPKPLEWIRAQDSASTGNARYFAVTGTQVVCWPPSGDIEGTYYEEIPGLESNATNWLMDSHPDLYLAACLTEALLYAQDEAMAAVWPARASALIDSVQRADDRNQLDGGVLAIRAR